MFRRNVFLHINEFQKHILYLALLNCLYGCVVSLLWLDYFYFDQGAIIHEGAFVGLKSAVVWFALIMAFLSFGTACYVYFVSNKILGALDRVLKELDDVVAGKRKAPITVRKGDRMFAAILDRVNVLIERLPDNTNNTG